MPPLSLVTYINICFKSTGASGKIVPHEGRAWHQVKAQYKLVGGWQGAALLELSQSSTPTPLRGPGETETLPPPLYLITQPVLIDLGLGVAVVHGHLLAQDVEGVLRGKAEHSEA